MTPDNHISELAAGLSKAQRAALVALTEEPQLARRHKFSAQAAFNMVHQGLVGIGFDQALLRDTYYLTPLGLAVRQYLLTKDPHHD